MSSKGDHHHLYFLDWRPVSGLPIRRAEAKELCFQGKELADLVGSSLAEPILNKIEYVRVAARTDGIFCFCIAFTSPPNVSHRAVASRVLSYFIKRELKHVHDFHKLYRGERHVRLWEFWRRAEVLNPDTVLWIEPIWVDLEIDPDDLLSVMRDDKQVKAILPRFSGGVHQGALRPALIRLRRIYLSKHEICVEKIHTQRRSDRTYKQHFWYVALPVWNLVFVAVSFLFPGNPLQNVIFAIILAGAISVSTYYFKSIRRQQAPIIRLLRHTIGFFHYTCVYSRLVQRLYCKTEAADFGNIIGALQTRLDSEIRELETLRYRVSGSIAVAGVIITLYGVPVWGTTIWHGIMEHLQALNL